MPQFLTVPDQLLQLDQRTLGKSLELPIAHSSHFAHLSLHVPYRPVNPGPDLKLILLGLLQHGRFSQLFSLQTRGRLTDEGLLTSDDVLLDQYSQLVGEQEGLDRVHIVAVGDCADHQEAAQGVLKEGC